ncbi:putative membrane protein [Rhodococcus sp. LBL1]|nr:putative membrane protein [Rhodococcus sp. LBL1]MDH6683011.1 putative membrane protein [Rhodococcus sp. LBL2]
MIWVTWRQFRTTILAAVSAILLLAVVAVICGLTIRGTNSPEPFGNFFGCVPGDGSAECWAESTLTMITLVTVVLPVLLGVLVGVTVFSRDLEHGTHVLGLSQSVSRARWYWMRVLVVFVPVTLATIVLGAALEWTRTVTAGPNYAFVATSWSGYSQLTFPLFQSTWLIAGSYTFLALIVGSLVGLLLRNTLGAMTVTLIAMAALMVGFQVGARPHYATPVVEAQPLGSTGRSVAYMPDVGSVWVLSSGFVDADGRVMNFDYFACTRTWTDTDTDTDWSQRPDETLDQYEERQDTIQAEQDRAFAACQRAQGIDHFETRYHPDSLFRRFQLTEAALALVLSALLLIPSLWALRRLRP